MNHIPEKEMTGAIALAMRKESMKLLCEVPIKGKALSLSLNIYATMGPCPSPMSWATASAKSSSPRSRR
jgi:hypothetical protein